jgi:hypothetical protein
MSNEMLNNIKAINENILDIPDQNYLMSRNQPGRLSFNPEINTEKLSNTTESG